MNNYDATIAILTFNGEEFLEDLLTSATNQDTKLKYEILVVDSGSTDRTLEIVKKFPKVRLHEISNKDFGHGRTRNLAANMSESDFVVYLTQDAVPASKKWLDYMVEPFSISEKVSCVFGKQIPRPHCFVTLKREVAQVFQSFGDDASISLQRRTNDTENLGITNNFLSDVNSAVRRSIIKRIPFKDVNYAEDQVLAIEMLEQGYIKAYAPLGGVFHSHDYPLRKYFKRKFDEYVGLRKSTGYIARVGTKDLYVGSIKATLGDYRYLLKDKDFGSLEKIHDFFLAPFYNFANRLAIRKAANSLTDKEIRKHSLEASVRNKTD
jgi:rhamnosyltransferase